MLFVNKMAFRRFLRLPVKSAKRVLLWMEGSVLKDSLMEPSSWLDIAFVLNKERWNGDLDWLEDQPITKILTMIDVTKRHFDRQKASMKSAR